MSYVAERQLMDGSTPLVWDGAGEPIRLLQESTSWVDWKKKKEASKKPRAKRPRDDGKFYFISYGAVADKACAVGTVELPSVSARQPVPSKLPQPKAAPLRPFPKAHHQVIVIESSPAPSVVHEESPPRKKAKVAVSK
jgi:hypothetical protein